MLFDDTYKTIDKAAQAPFKDRGSRFIGYVQPISNESDFKAFLEAVKKEHPSATHHCYAYRLGMDKTAFRVNDDGEPSGSAGRPILNQLLSQELTNIGAIVVRYYGGTMLGIPGLINAYKTATVEALQQSKIISKTLCSWYQLQFSYEQMNAVMQTIKQQHWEMKDQQLEENCQLTLGIRNTEVNKALDLLEKIDNTRMTFLYEA